MLIPSHGVSSGPNTVAFHTNRFSSPYGLALQPCPKKREFKLGESDEKPIEEL